MKPYHLILTSIDAEFSRALEEFRHDPLFENTSGIYTDYEKKQIGYKWASLVRPLRTIQRLLLGMTWRSWFWGGKKNNFVIKYALTITYYNMLYEIRSTFGSHEEFLRQYLDEHFRVNYSTLARYMYRSSFYSILIFPREFFLSLRGEVDPSLDPLFDRPERMAGELSKHWYHDRVDIAYYITYRIGLVATWVARNFGRHVLAHIYLTRPEAGLITRSILDQILPQLEGGDIILTRKNWAATNLSIPGFWKHMSMYVGTGSSLKKLMYDSSMIRNLDDHTHYIIEAVGSGVRITPLHDLALHNDYLGVIRANVSGTKKEHALEKTLELVGREYDYSFNFYTDRSYICSTLITKAYLPDRLDAEGVHISLRRIGLGLTYPPNDLVIKMSEEITGNHPELSFVAFIDARESTNETFVSNSEQFLTSGKRGRLSFFLQ